MANGTELGPPLPLSNMYGFSRLTAFRSTEIVNSNPRKVKRPGAIVKRNVIVRWFLSGCGDIARFDVSAVLRHAINWRGCASVTSSENER